MGLQTTRQGDSEAAEPQAASDDCWKAASVYLPDTLLRALRQRPDSSPQWIEPLEGTLLLADVSGFTSMSELLAEMGTEGAELLTTIINHYFQQMLDIASSFGGSNAKFAGDALLLVFAGEEHANRAVATALAMQRAARRFPPVRIGARKLRLGMSMGVHSGRFWSAAAGLPDLRMQHFLLGAEVSRLAAAQGTAASGEVLMTPETRALAHRAIGGEDKGDGVIVEGLSRPMKPAPIDLDRSGAMPRRDEVLAFLPPLIAAAAAKNEVPRPAPGEHRRISVAFINVMGTNDVLAAEGPQVLLAQLDRYLASVLRLGERYGAYLVSNDIDIRGLKLILLFGAPVAHEEDAENCLRLAAALNEEMPSLGLSLQHRVGVNRGLVFAGDVGAGYRREYTVMGDVVNLSARLMAAASAGQVLISRDLALEAGRGYRLRDLPPVRVKGKREAVRMWALEGQRSAAPVAEDEDLPPLVGREEELGRFSTAGDAVEAGNSRALVVSGEAGIGKTRLVLEWQKLARSRGWTVHQGKCYSHTAGQPYAPWVQVLFSLMQLDPGESVAERTGRAAQVIARMLPRGQDLASLLNPLLSLDLPQSDLVRALDDEGRRLGLFNLIAEFLEAASRAAPLLLTFEDMQWADGSTVQLIGHVSIPLAGSRLALCLTTRGADDVPLPTPEASTVRVPLKELPRDNSLQLLRQLREREQLTEDALEEIVERSGGNPLFIEEMARAVQQASESGRPLLSARRRRTGEADISDRVQSLIMPRVDALDPGSRDVFRAASVAGMDFDAPVVAALVGSDASDRGLSFSLDELERRDFIVRAGSGFRFRHTLMQEVVYDSISFAQRRRLHQRTALYIEDTQRGRLDPYFGILVHHYSRSGDGPKTVEFALKAGDQALTVWAHDEAIDYYTRGLGAVNSRGAEAEARRSVLLERIGDCNDLAGRYKEAADSLVQALRRSRLAERGPDERQHRRMLRARRAHLCRKVASTYERRSDYDTSLKWLDSASELLPRGEPLLGAQITVGKAVLFLRKGQYEEAIRWGQIGLEMARRAGDAKQLAYAHDVLASPLRETGDLKRALSHRQKAVQLYEETGDLPGQARGHSNLGACYQELGDLDNAIQHYETARRTHERIGNLFQAAVMDNNLGEVLLIRGRLDEAEERLRQVTDRSASRADLRGYALVNLSRVYAARGMRREAWRRLEHGIRLLGGAGARGLLVEAEIWRAELQLETGGPREALAIVWPAYRQARRLGRKLVDARALTVIGRIAAAEKRFKAAEANLIKSAELAERLGAGYERGRALLALAQVYGAGHDATSRRRAGRVRGQAIAVFRRLGAEVDLARALST